MLGALGFALNGLQVPVFGEVSLVFGGVFALLAALALGPFYGALAAFVAGSRTWWLWGHPFAMVIAVLEAAAIGSMVRRRGTPAVVSSLAFWAFAGVPLLALIYGVGWLKTSTTEVAWAIFLKQPINGLFNVLLAELLLMLQPVRRHLVGLGSTQDRQTIRGLLIHGITLLATVPLLALATIHSQAYSSQSQQAIEDALVGVTREVGGRVDGHLIAHRDAIVALAESLDVDIRVDSERVTRRLEETKRVYEGFLTLLATDEEGTLRAACPRSRLEGVQELPSIKDREYFRQPFESGEPFISEAFRGRGFGEDPIVAISAPYPGGSRNIRGVVEGSLNLSYFKSFAQEDERLAEKPLLILDSADRVIFASPGLPFDPLENLAGSPLLLAASRHEGVFRHRLSLEEGLDATFLVSRIRSMTSGWKVFVHLPIQELHRGLQHYYLASSLGVLTAILLSLLLARLIADRVTIPLEALLGRIRRFQIPGSGARPQEEEAEDAPLEIHQLIDDFQGLSQRLNESYGQLKTGLEERERLNRDLQALLTDLDVQVKRRTAELSEAKRRAETSNRAKGDLLASTSHEIRTPMNGIVGMAELLLEEPLGSRQKSYAEAIHNSAEALLRILDDVLDFSKIEAGKLSLEAVDFRPRSLVDGVVTLLTPRAREQGIDLEQEVAPDLPARFRGDPARLRQVLINLVGNAIKFTEKGKVTVRVRPERRFADSTQIYFEVLDTGIGIPEEASSGLFQPFFQSTLSTNRIYGGTGLGLAICKQIVDLMGGQIGFDSTPGKGSTFWFRVQLELAEFGTQTASLPTVRRPEPAPSQAKSPRQLQSTTPPETSPPSPGTPPKGPRILVAEDNAINRTVALSQLEALGYRGKAVENGEEALEILQQETFAGVLMDCQMPVMDGYAAVRALREREDNGNRLPVIAVTAHALKGERERCLDAGMDDFLAKPLRLNELSATLEQWVPNAPEERKTEISMPNPEESRAQAEESSGDNEGIDIETISQIQQLGKDLGRDLLSQVLGALLESLPERLDRLQELAEKGDGEGVKQLAHSLKGSAGNAGAIRLSQIFGELQDVATETDGRPLIAKAAVELERVEPRLRQILEES